MSNLKAEVKHRPEWMKYLVHGFHLGFQLVCLRVLFRLHQLKYLLGALLSEASRLVALTDKRFPLFRQLSNHSDAGDLLVVCPPRLQMRDHHLGPGCYEIDVKRESLQVNTNRTQQQQQHNTPDKQPGSSLTATLISTQSVVPGL